jgi:tRNA pseudouridine32 synthase / 23S rRNA pseudouridine746 synthase
MEQDQALVSIDTCFHKFAESIDGIELPQKFTYPFCYDPHPLSLIAAGQLQKYLSNKSNWQNGFGPGENPDGMGKMFGVMVVKDSNNDIGFICSFSGKLLGSNDHIGFVPPVFDLLVEDGFYRIGEQRINDITIKIELLENDFTYINAKNELTQMQEKSRSEIQHYKKLQKENKRIRDEKRLKLESIDEVSRLIEIEKLNNESIHEKYTIKDLIAHWKFKIDAVEKVIYSYEQQMDEMKVQRKSKSYDLQRQLFDHYAFLNAHGHSKDLNTIFEIAIQGPPPSGAGECAAPKLFQYAYLNGYTPICMAEFWWGPSPLSEVRKHSLFYPSCKSKCEPILGHMLVGLEIEDNPLLLNPAVGKELSIVYEDDAIVIVDKPAEFLSVPGVNISDSVYTRIKDMYPQATGPLIVHRLDMSTSGLLMIAKTKESHKYLQRQFIKRTIKKRYVALLDGIIENKEGIIELPLRLDLDNRPTQLVDFEFGKPASTRYEVIKVKDGKTLVYFYPMTGRTHQLRVHAAHPLGLNTPILGDDLYGKRGNRLHLHAEMLEFVHPVSKQLKTVVVSPEF